jgi:hypothetical protein
VRPALILVAALELGCRKPAPAAARNPAAACDFSARYTYRWEGANSPEVAWSELAPGNRYRHTVTSRAIEGQPDPTVSCAPPLPACDAPDAITAREIERLVAGDVQAALDRPTPPLFGHDPRTVDTEVFQFRRADGRGFGLGARCVFENCAGVPAGVARLAKRLVELDVQQLFAWECKPVRER